jgi:large subunit ribosomal protein L21
MTDPQERADADLAPRPDLAPEPTSSGADEALVTDPAAGTSAESVVLEGEPATVTATGDAERKRRPKATVPVARPPSPYAIIETGGKQYRVSVGDSVAVERLPSESGADVTIDRVLLLGGNGATRVGTPTVPGATVTARVDDQYRGEKIVVFKYKAKKRYRRRMGHRQSLTRLTITGIAG